jgi:hypothetical protein
MKKAIDAMLHIISKHSKATLRELAILHVEREYPQLFQSEKEAGKGLLHIQ